MTWACHIREVNTTAREASADLRTYQAQGRARDALGLLENCLFYVTSELGTSCGAATRMDSDVSRYVLLWSSKQTVLTGNMSDSIFAPADVHKRYRPGMTETGSDTVIPV